MLRPFLNIFFKHKPGFIIAFLVISISVCYGQRDYHLINVLPVTFHDNENQLHLAAAIGMGSGVDLVISYSVNEEFAVFATGNMNIWSRTKLNILSLASDYKVEKNDYSISGGLMRFKNYDNTLLESYVGYGLTEGDNYWHYLHIFTVNPFFSDSHSVFWLDPFLCRVQNHRVLR